MMIQNTDQNYDLTILKWMFTSVRKRTKISSIFFFFNFYKDVLTFRTYVMSAVTSFPNPVCGSIDSVAFSKDRIEKSYFYNWE